MSWEIWKRPQPGQKINYWKRPSLDTIDETSTSIFFCPSTSWNMTDNWQGNAWGSGPTTTPANDQWNSGPADTTDWNDGGAGINSFDDPPTADDTGPSGDGDEGTARARGGCFNCGEGILAEPFCLPVLTHCTEGHNKADCTKPRVFTGTCRTCNQEG